MKTKPETKPVAPATSLFTLRPTAPATSGSTADRPIKPCILSADRTKVIIETDPAGNGDTAILRVIKEIEAETPVVFFGKRGKENTVNAHFGKKYSDLSAYFKTQMSKIFGTDNDLVLEKKWNKVQENAKPKADPTQNIVNLAVWE